VDRTNSLLDPPFSANQRNLDSESVYATMA